MKMKLAHKIIVGFTVLTLLSGIFSSFVFYTQASKLDASALSGPQALQDYVKESKKIAITIGALSLVLGALITFVLVKQIVTPIQAIGLALSAYVKNGKKSRIVIPNKDEIGALALYVNEIMNKK